MPPTPIFFDSPAAFRDWLAAHHDSATEVHVGYHKVHTGKPTLTWPQSVDEALCYGWIDGVRRSLGEDAYTIRFTPRKPTSIWSAVNMKRVPELIAAGRMQPAGVAAWERRSAAKSAIYAYEREHATFDPAYEQRFRAKKKAWTFFEAQPPGYRRLATYWVMNAKRAETRDKRLASLIACSANGERLPQYVSPGRSTHSTPKRRA